MKHYLVLCLVVCLLLMGCSRKVTTKIDLETAKSIAFEKYPDCEIVSIVHNAYSTPPSYIITLTDHKYLYVVEVDSTNGALTQQHRQHMTNPYASLSISVAKAKELALNYHNGELVDFYLTEINDMPYYNVSINDGTYLYSLTVDALTGETTEVEHHIIGS